MGDVEAELAEALLLDMDGDFLPAAGMSIGNEDEDVALRHARPKEVAWWAAGVCAPMLAAHVAAARAEELDEALREAADEVHIEARWQQEMVVRHDDDRLLRSYTVERLTVVESILLSRATGEHIREDLRPREGA